MAWADTVIIFQSDNGAEGAEYEAIPTMGADLMQVVNKYCETAFRLNPNLG